MTNFINNSKLKSSVPFWSSSGQKKSINGFHSVIPYDECDTFTKTQTSVDRFAGTGDIDSDMMIDLIECTKCRTAVPFIVFMDGIHQYFQPHTDTAERPNSISHCDQDIVAFYGVKGHSSFDSLIQERSRDANSGEYVRRQAEVRFANRQVTYWLIETTEMVRAELSTLSQITPAINEYVKTTLPTIRRLYQRDKYMTLEGMNLICIQ
ncbi:hypothetical protein RF11_13723 [Thelohanellus kitauei]|uniref:Uncharacterized protein n=1 Tax=Thelohanellus kitauei TaxID=669202 RepID=A0A0C2IYX7_THEKT|nr:hypothetical protein RF11_13723 [Thelohanellus kitauei]